MNDEKLIIEEEEIIVCYECGYEVDEEDAYEIDGKYYCDGCIIVCDCCGEIKLNDDITTTGDNELVCQSCLEEHYFYCEYCGDWEKKSHMVTDSENSAMCEYCYDNYFRCCDCGEFVHEDDACHSNGETYCEYCYDNCSGRNGVIWEYHDRPTYVYHGNSNTRFGIELEIDDGEDSNGCATEIQQLLGEDHVYFNYDGSLNSDGFEIISHPHSIEEFRKLNIEEMCNIAKKYKYKSHDTTTCGLHVHVSRTAFGDDKVTQDINIAKIIYFFENHWKDIIKFSRRKEDEVNRWARAYTDINCDTDTAEMIVKNQRDRYTAVNLCNSQTVEFRIFKGTLNHRTIRATVEFCNLIIENAKRYEIDDIPFLSFIDWVEGADNNLMRYISKRYISGYSTKEVLALPKEIRAKAGAIMVGLGCGLDYATRNINNYKFIEDIKSTGELIRRKFLEAFGFECESDMSYLQFSMFNNINTEAAQAIMMNENLRVTRFGTLKLMY